MSSAAYATPLRLELRPSRRLAVAMAAVHAAAALMPWTLPVHPVAAFLGSAAVLAAGARVWWLHLGGAAAITSVHWDAEDVWHFRRRDGGIERGRLLPQGYLHPGLAVLRYAVTGENVSVRAGWPAPGTPSCRVLVLAPDSCADPDGLRRLRVRLRLMSESGES